ncbi:glycosyltransferase family 2 protein [Marinobacter psychrophilus]|jgi:NDP-sugar pyrophosphorylase family protein|uniref:glycosyltransferase family 2 protein n=1 Tax=Marinobacter psychrophilus TaxID=330734 RepID=UPI001B5B614F|nr:glycosyltransferase family 2 protein [Marinobacter psychrophilus]MBQ0761687.1 glycosyltransferase family 2 protein [Marinobacter psychrophilus]MBQ0844221.1 glycosyltransferase family 2 protein [Marinobacter psychrophilus]
MIVIPMAGLSSRFFKAGFKLPKYMLEAHGKTLFEHSVQSFEHYFATHPFVFIVRDIFETSQFVEAKAQALGIKDFRVVTLQDETRGQAETVYLALKALSVEKGPITLFNIDTFRPDFRFPQQALIGDGFLEVFEGEGSNWSFARPLSGDSQRVTETAEKNPISNLCSDGLYHFSDAGDFIESFEHYEAQPCTEWAKGELYIAPLYNYLIKNERSIFYTLIRKDEIVFCGTPDEYQKFLLNTIQAPSV